MIGLLVGVVLVACLSFVWLTGSEESDSRDDYDISNTVRYGLRIRNTTNRVVIGGELSVFAPVKQTSYQWCDGVEASADFEVVGDALGFGEPVTDRLDLVPPVRQDRDVLQHRDEPGHAPFNRDDPEAFERANVVNALRSYSNS